MTRNVGTADRIARTLAALGLFAGAALAPLPLGTRLAVFLPMAVYVAFTALAGTCLGYRLMGRSTCSASR
jgi:hypothetical protein